MAEIRPFLQTERQAFGGGIFFVGDDVKNIP